MSNSHSIPETVVYLRSLEAVRDRSQQVFELATKGELDHWDWHQEKFPDVVDYCAARIERVFGKDYNNIPPHCRRNHFITPSPSGGTINRIDSLLSNPAFPPTNQPLARAATLIDLYLVSVLLDAGAGNAWVYTEIDESGKEIWKGGRSEGLAVASYRMFLSGVFSSDPTDKLRVDAKGLKALTPEIMAQHLQVSESNPMAGLEGRCNLLIKLGDALLARPDICNTGRPGDLIAYFEPKLLHPTNSPPTLPLKEFWIILLNLLLPIWPSRTTLPSNPTYLLGDVWPCPSLNKSLASKGSIKEGDDYVPFHKLTQWLCYSLVEGIESQTGWVVDRGRGQTGLPEYRNGGLLIDLGALSIRPESLPASAYPKGPDHPPSLEPWHPAIIEWRAITVIALDLIHQGVLAKLGVTDQELSLTQVLEAATWVGGREVAAAKRAGGGPPIEIISDGTVF